MELATTKFDLGIIHLTSSIWLDLPTLVYWVANKDVEKQRREECADTQGSDGHSQAVLPETHSVAWLA
jgi:hypothetical protein